MQSKQQPWLLVIMMCRSYQVQWIMFLSISLKLLFTSVSLQLCTWAPLHLCFKRWSKRDSEGSHVQTRREEEIRETVYKTGWEISASQPGGNQLWASSGKHSRKSYSRPRRQGRLDKSQRLEKALVISQSALLWRAAWRWRVRYHGWNDNSEMNECLPCAPGSLSQHPGGRWKDDCRHRDKMESGKVQELAAPILHLNFVSYLYTKFFFLGS